MMIAREVVKSNQMLAIFGVGWEEKRIKDASKVLAEATEKMELFNEIRKATVRRVLGRKIRVHLGNQIRSIY